jgi:hypothetical protein
MIVIIAFSCKSEQSVLKSDLELANLKGKVWKIDKTFHDANGKCSCPAATKTECNQSQYVYDKEGNLTESCTIDENGKININTKYIYDRPGVCSEIDKYSGEQLIGKEVSVLDGTKVTGYKIYNENGINETTLDYEYTGDEISEEKTLNNTGEVISSVKNEFINGQLVSQTEKDNNGEVKSITRYKRNDNNDIVEYLISVPKDNKEYLIKYEYEYDSEGNWVKQTQLYNGQIVSIILRNIEYFNS